MDIISEKIFKMFDFEKLEVYQHLKSTTIEVLKFIAANKISDDYLKDQLRRAALSALLNLSEGTGRRSPADKKRFYTTARSSIFEVVAILDVLRGINEIDSNQYHTFYDQYTQGSKMLLGMYRSFEAKV